MPPIRKQESGHEKRKRKKRIEQLNESQRGALNRFIIKDPQNYVENPNIDNVSIDASLSMDVSLPVENVNCDDVPIENNVDAEIIDDILVENDTVEQKIPSQTCRKADDFFGVIQRIYTIFACSTKRWHILKENVKGLTLKSLSSTRWESRVDSVKAIRFQMSEIREALLQVADIDNDSKVKSEAKSLATNELGDFEFLIAIIIWYEILCAINVVSKFLQSKDMLIDVAIEKINGLISFFETYRENGFNNALDCAKKLATEMNIDPIFPHRREIRRKKHFDENSSTSSIAPLSGDEEFRVNYFLYIVDQALSSLNRRFEQFKNYESVFGFLFTSHKFKSLDDTSLKNSCTQFENALKHNELSDIDGNELYVELKLLREVLPGDVVGAIDSLKFLKDLDCFPNVFIAYRILLTIPVTVASAERSFSKLKLLKTYMRSTMLQERLNGLAMIAIENELLESVDYEDLIDDFASKSARRMSFFK